MRTKEELNSNQKIIESNRVNNPVLANAQTADLILEVLLDIRELLEIKK